MDLTHLIIAGITAALNLAALVIPGSSPWHAIAIGAVAVLGGMSALVAGHQSASTATTSTSALSVGTKPATVVQFPAPSTQVWQPAPEEDQQGKP